MAGTPQRLPPKGACPGARIAGVDGLFAGQLCVAAAAAPRVRARVSARARVGVKPAAAAGSAAQQLHALRWRGGPVPWSKRKRCSHGRARDAAVTAGHVRRCEPYTLRLGVVGCRSVFSIRVGLVYTIWHCFYITCIEGGWVV